MRSSSRQRRMKGEKEPSNKLLEGEGRLGKGEININGHVSAASGTGH